MHLSYPTSIKCQISCRLKLLSQLKVFYFHTCDFLTFTNRKNLQIIALIIVFPLLKVVECRYCTRAKQVFVLTVAQTHSPGCSTLMFRAACYTTQLSRCPLTRKKDVNKIKLAITNRSRDDLRLYGGFSFTKEETVFARNHWNGISLLAPSVTRLCFLYLAIYSNENLPKRIQIVPK